MFGGLLNSLMRDTAQRSPFQRSKGRRPRKHLIDPRYRATVIAVAKPNAVYPNGFYEVQRDSIVTHFICNGGGGWFVRRAGRNGMSNHGYKTAEAAAKAYKLVLHGWKDA